MITTRPETPWDAEFLFLLYASTREEELAVVEWEKSAKETFLRSQFKLQSTHFREHYPEASFEIIQLDGRAIGRLYVYREGPEIHILDIALLPEARGQGIGTAFLRQILQEGRDKQRAVTLYVEKFNRAQQLYARLGFQQIEDEGVYWKLEWRPESSSPA